MRQPLDDNDGDRKGDTRDSELRLTSEREIEEDDRIVDSSSVIVVLGHCLCRMPWLDRVSPD